jgi:hypothetical protein
MDFRHSLGTEVPTSIVQGPGAVRGEGAKWSQRAVAIFALLCVASPEDNKQQKNGALEWSLESGAEQALAAPHQGQSTESSAPEQASPVVVCDY